MKTTNVVEKPYDEDLLRKLELAPWIVKATRLISKPRWVGGNMFRHQISTFAILIDHHFDDRVLLKASVCHDLLEDATETDPEDLIRLDKDGSKVVKLIQEVSRDKGKTKEQFLLDILHNKSESARIIKCADRIDNLTDLNSDIFDNKRNKTLDYLEDTRLIILEMAEKLNHTNFKQELYDLYYKKLKTVFHFKLSDRDFEDHTRRLHYDDDCIIVKDYQYPEI